MTSCEVNCKELESGVGAAVVGLTGRLAESETDVIEGGNTEGKGRVDE